MRKRNTLAKRIGRESGLEGKLALALGESPFRFVPNQTDKLDAAALISHVDRLTKDLNRLRRMAEDGQPVQKRILEMIGHEGSGQGITSQTHELACIGGFIAAQIKDRNHAFFSRLAAVMQYGSKPQKHPMYAAILSYCLVRDTGTKESPCCTSTLLAHLKANGFRFESNYSNEFPRSLRAVCKKLGVVLQNGRIGRPQKSER